MSEHFVPSFYKVLAERQFRVALRAVSLICFLSVVTTSNAIAEDWPQFRGPTNDGHSAELDLVESWPSGGPPVLWAKEIGAGYSGFVVVGDRAFTLAQSLHQQFVLCLDANSGETIWTHRYALPYEGGLYPGPRSTPTVSGDRVVFAAPNGLIGCVRASDGRALWQIDVHRKFRGQGTDFGYSASPLIVDELVIVPVGGAGASVVALKLSDGSVAWQSGDFSASYATPISMTWRGHKLIVVLLENSLAAFDQQTGELWWDVELSHGYDEHSAQPLYREPYLLIAAPFKAAARMFELIEDKQSGRCRPQRTWESSQLANDVASNVLVGDFVFGFDLKEAQSRHNRPSRGEYRCLEWQTGKVRWSTSRVGQANAIVVGDKLLLFNDGGELVLARATGESYQELSRSTVFSGDVSWTMPAFSRGRLFVRSQSQAVCLFLGSQALDRSTSPSAITVSDIPKRSRFDPTSLIGGEREFPAMTPEWSELRAWFGWSCGLIISCGLLAALVAYTSQLRPTKVRGIEATSQPARARLPLIEGQSQIVRWRRAGFGLLLLVTSIIGSPLLNVRSATYLFLWPLTLWVGWQFAAMASFASHGSRFASWPRMRSYLAGFAFLGLCGGYYHLCRLLGLATEWSFLVGFLPSFPITHLAARWLTRSHRLSWLTDIVASLLSFGAYFWSSTAFVKWWMTVGT